MDVKVTRALISVSDKTGIVELGQALAGLGIEILSTGGTAKALEKAGVPITPVADYTQVPEMMDGRVKTLTPKIHGGLLALRDNEAHVQAMQEHNIKPIDLLVINLYPFEAALRQGAPEAEMIEQIDIGGPAMLRAAAKNHGFVTVVTDPADYAGLITMLQKSEGKTTLDARRHYAAKTYALTASYDAMISGWFAGQLGDTLPERMSFSGKRRQSLRYGENPHQAAAFYVTGEDVPGVATATQRQGKELSFNNIHDTDAAFDLVAEFDAPAAAIIKHANPCGVATAATLSEAYEKALASDPVSAFGGIIALNRPLDGETAAHISSLFAEVVIAPGADKEALDLLSGKSNLRILTTEGMPAWSREAYQVKTVAGGLLVQTRDHKRVEKDELRVVTNTAPTDAQMEDMLLAFQICKHVKSNAIVLVKDGATVGIGGGQTSRVDAVRQSIWQANELAAEGREPEMRSEGAVLASDAFFPFADNISLAAEAGISAIIQPGGSKRDDEVISAANAAGIAMVFTGRRHFKH